jgi:multidrug efflux pump subunit AcrA (membrane-fusion protein)
MKNLALGLITFLHPRREVRRPSHSNSCVRRLSSSVFLPPPAACRLSPLISCLLILIALINAGCHKKEAAENEVQPVVSVKAAKVTRRDIIGAVMAAGAVFPQEQATVSAKVSAPIAKMALLKNKTVKSGEILVELESKDLRASVAEAEGALREAKANEQQTISGNIPQTMAQNEKVLRDAQDNLRNAQLLYQRRNDLYQKGGIAKKDVEAAQLAMETAENELKLAQQQIDLRKKNLNSSDIEIAHSRVQQAQEKLNTAQTQLSYSIIRSPIDGIVTDQYQYQGEFAAAGAKLFTVMNLNEIIVKAQIPENIAQKLSLEAPVSISALDLPDEKFSGHLSLIGKNVDPANRNVEIWARAANKNERLRAGAPVNIKITTNIAHNAIAIPIKAVTFDNPMEKTGTVMVVDKNSIAHATQVVTGIKQDDIIEVESGLNGDETIVTEGNYQLPDNSKVQIVETKSNELSKDDHGGPEQGSAENEKSSDSAAEGDKP